MRFKVDENLPAEVVKLLADAGHDGISVLSQKMSGKPDGKVASVCAAESRALITLDLDFADIRIYPPASYPGIIVLRPRQQDKHSVLAIIVRLIPILPTQPLDKHLWIVDETTIRTRTT